MITFNAYRPRCTSAATLTSADRSVTVQVSLLEPGEGRPPRLRVTTGDRRPQIVGLSVAPADGSVVEIDLTE
ncbi:MAG: hypothetical protein ABWX84_09055 [Nocardioides sp.]